MKGQSDTAPADFIKSNGKTQCNYNIVETQKTDLMTGVTRTVFEYDYVEVEGEVTKSKFLEKINDNPWSPTKEYNKFKMIT